jgi:hypothetical protein
LLKKNGTVIGIDSAEGVLFDSVSSGLYYIVIKHRNHLAVMSYDSIALPNSSAFDFTTAMSQAYGAVTTELSKPMKDMTGSGPFAMFAGDVNGNGVIKISGAGNDKDLIYVRIGSGSVGAIRTGYWNEDTNMNGQVKLSGVSNDANNIYANIGGGSVGPTRSSRVP